MNVLVLGATGMLGHKVMQTLSGQWTVTGTVRGRAAEYERHPILGRMALIGDVAAEQFDTVERALGRVRPDVVINCIGIVKQLPAGADPVSSIGINALFPHQLAGACRQAAIRLIHISTDCVFSGRQGNYTEADTPDADDLYGRTKLLGEVTAGHCLTLRTSLIGRELHGRHGLIEWFLGQQGKTIRGYTRAVFSGLTTQAVAEALRAVIADHPALQGLWHMAAEPISKFDLLTLVKRVYDVKIEIAPDEAVVCDRSLNGEKFRRAAGYRPPTWPEMITQMHEDATPYASDGRFHVDG